MLCTELGTSQVFLNLVFITYKMGIIAFVSQMMKTNANSLND